MKVLFAERKGLPAASVREGRTEFLAAVKTSTVMMLTCPLLPSTLAMFGSQEFAVMRADAIVINVARGGVAVEEDLVTVLRERRISGAATDVFVEEPAGRSNNVLVRAAAEFKEDPTLYGRLLLSPHVAWWARSSLEKLRSTVSANVEAWARGEPQNLVI